MAIGLNAKWQIYKIPEENTGEYLHNLSYGLGFLDTKPKAWSMGKNKDKLDIMKWNTSAL